ncbi:MAG: glycosyltransferase [Syntrophomonadaceae bacterium]|jgi:glycosyltransferase involved in cell wall biosynthesis|nr:glycosyltransferase [Syntrophomonadaceae bacterium]
MNVLNVGTYSPQQCGIASFSKDLRDNLMRLGERISIAAVSDPHYTYQYPHEVSYVLRQTQKSDYANTANAVNSNIGIDLVIVQHEYGIYGGADGNYLLDFTSHLKKPFVLVTHTVLPTPTASQRTVLRNLCRQATAVVCMTETSALLASQLYEAASEKVYVIQHGLPPFPQKNRCQLKREYGFADKDLITTFGLIGPGKGIEIVIRTLPELVTRHRNLMYLIVGRTHPLLVKHEGERYRDMLTDLVIDLGLQDHVSFINRFLEPEELGDYLYMTDIYLSPYPQMGQSISGTLAYALGCGRAIVSTPHIYAQMAGQEQRGLVAPDTTPQSLAKLLNRILSEPDLKLKLEKRAASLGRKIKWPYIAQQYAVLGESILKS